MRVLVLGVGYVGLVSGACFAEMGNHVLCVDINAEKIHGLHNGLIPIYEPGLDKLVASGIENKLLVFSTSISDGIKNAEYIFIAVGTPPSEDGSADLGFVLDAARQIGQHLDHYAVIVNKSTVPVGTAEKVKSVIAIELQKREVVVEFDVVSNPEFLKEGAAVEDFMKPDRVIVGSDSQRAAEKMEKLYSPFIRSNDRIMIMGVRDAEMTKYAANAMMATKISFMNEMANLCDRMGVDVEHVRKGIGSDSRIGYSFIYPGCGYGGSCFPKDVKALIYMAESHQFDAVVLNAIETRNHQQKQVLFDKIVAEFGEDLFGRVFGVWGLAFKPGTDDVREAPSLILIKALVGSGARVLAYDPVASASARRELPPEWIEKGLVTLVANEYDALRDADAMILVTEWKRFRQPDFESMSALLKQPFIFDGRNQYDPDYMASLGFVYRGIGRSN